MIFIQKLTISLCFRILFLLKVKHLFLKNNFSNKIFFFDSNIVAYYILRLFFRNLKKFYFKFDDIMYENQPKIGLHVRYEDLNNIVDDIYKNSKYEDILLNESFEESFKFYLKKAIAEGMFKNSLCIRLYVLNVINWYCKKNKTEKTYFIPVDDFWFDELSKYASNIYGKSSSGLNCTFDSLVTFCQSLTEAVKDKSANALVVASIPQSDIEMGGEAGMKASKILENTFGRVVSIWKPVEHREGFEIVRRRLFKGNFDESMRERVCEAFNKMYKEYDTDFPSKCKELDYLKRLKSCYPIHPEVFDRLYDDWTTIDIFQETRGVLRLMAAAIHKLWIDNDRSLMIMPGSLPIGAKDVHAELTRYLDD